MNASEIIICQLSHFAWREGQRLAPGSRPAMLGIAHVIRNRVELGWMSGEWLKLMADSPIHSASLVEEMDWRSYVDIWDPTFRWLYGQCVSVFDGSLKDAITVSADTRWTGGKDVPKKGLFYCNLQIPVRPWFMENIIRQREEHPHTADAGTVTFFA